MCGIIYAKNLKGQPARDMILQQYHKQRTRGTDGFGYVSIAKPAKVVYKTKEESMLKTLKKEKGNEILFHHRKPTSTDNVLNACHPFKVKGKSGKTYYIVHNGIIHNDSELKVDHNSQGLNYRSDQKDGRFNDSESLAHDIMLYLEKKQEKLEAIGSIAFIAAEYSAKGNPTKIHWYHNCSASPLNAKFNKDKSIQISSEGPGHPVNTNILFTHSFRTKTTTEKPLETETYRRISPSYNSTEFNDSPLGAFKYYSKREYPVEFNHNENFDEGFTNGYEETKNLSFDIDTLIEACHTLGDLYEEKYEIVSSGDKFWLGDIPSLNDQIDFQLGFVGGVRTAIRELEEKGYMLEDNDLPKIFKNRKERYEDHLDKHPNEQYNSGYSTPYRSSQLTCRYR